MRARSSGERARGQIDTRVRRVVHRARVTRTKIEQSFMRQRNIASPCRVLSCGELGDLPNKTYLTGWKVERIQLASHES